MHSLESLEQISRRLGTFRERLRQARSDEQARTAALVGQLEARFIIRRGELS